MDPVEALHGLKPATYEEALDLVLNAVRQIILARHEEYGHKNLTRRGHLGMIVRTEDKLARIENADDSGAMAIDTITKAWGDTIGYAAQGILYELGWIGYPASETKETTNDQVQKITERLVKEIRPDAEFPWTPFIPKVKPLPLVPADPWAGYPYQPIVTYGNGGTVGDDGLPRTISRTEVD
jgi:hypothetical protein